MNEYAAWRSQFDAELGPAEPLDDDPNDMEALMAAGMKSPQEPLDGPPIGCKVRPIDEPLYAFHEHHLGSVNMKNGLWDGTYRYCHAVTHEQAAAHPDVNLDAFEVTF